MKRCPECRRDYYDETLLYCLDDGTPLLEGPGSGGSLPDEPQTAILHDTAAAGEAKTRAQIHTTTAPTETGGADGSRFRKLLVLAPIAIAIVILGGYLGYRYFAPSGQIRSIAVLPFDNVGGNADSEYLSDGLAETLIYRLSQLPELKVSSRSSVFRYKGKAIDAEQVGAELGVDAVMTGRLVHRGDNLTISVDLVDVRNKTTLWGEQFERRMSDLLATQREIASTITQKLQLKLTGDDASRITKRYTESNEAYQHYLQGRFYWSKRTIDSMPKGIEQFNAAIKADPNFALAYSGLADVQVVSQYFTRRWKGDYGTAAAIESARRAIELDPTLAEPHAALGLAYQHQWKWDEAERELRRAVELNPNYATAHHWLSRFLRIRGRSDEALSEIRKAREADPVSIVIGDNVTQSLFDQGDIDGAIAECRRLIDLDPQFWIVHMRLGFALIEKGNKDEGLAAAQRASELLNGATTSLGFLGYAQAAAGRRDEALATARGLEKRYSAGEGDGVRIASVYVGLGDKDKAFEWLERDFQAKRPSLVEIFQEPEFKELRTDPRFQDLRKRMDLAE
jgi:TolB-like protein/Flp pilus assembly protein TadD